MQAAAVERLGYEIREAVEAGDLATAARLRVERDRARFGSTMASGEPPVIPARGLLDEVGGLAKNRQGELRIGLLIGAVVGDPEWQTRAVLSALVGQPVHLPRLKEEARLFRAAGFVPVMWHEVLVQEPSPPLVKGRLQALDSLSADARSLLCLNALLRRRLTTPSVRLGERALLRPPRLQAALDELSSRGLADRTPTAEDRLGQATMAQLAELRAAHAIKGARTKGETIHRIVSSVPDQAIRVWMERTNPTWTADDVVVAGLGEESNALIWYEAFARLFAHSLQFQLYSDRDIRSAQAMGFFGWEVLKTDACPMCREAPDKVRLFDPDRLPPFHLGCRCDIAPLLEDPETGRPWLPPS